METNFRIDIRGDNIPFQEFNGRIYRLHSNAKYFTSHKWFMHRHVWEYFNGPIPKGFHVHHKDQNKWNNNIQNLELKEAKSHMSGHVKERFKNNPEWAKEFQRKGIAAAPEWHRSESGIEWHKQHAAAHGFGSPSNIKKDCNQCGKAFVDKSPTGHAKFCHANCKAKALRARYKAAGKCIRLRDRK